MEMNEYPLNGVRVVELGTHVAVPSATRILSTWGAEVIKVESLSGDQWRVVGRNQKCPIEDNENPFFDIQNANKTLIALNLKDEAGKKVLMALLEEADIFVTSMRLHALKKLGLDYDSLKSTFPGLIYGHFTGYGYEGPDSEKPGFDSVAFWARSGAMADWVTDSSYPLQPPTAAGDLMSGAMLCNGLLAALLAKRSNGRGTLVSNSLYGSAIWYSSSGILSTQYGNTFPKTQDRPLNPLGYAYRCRDGQWVMIGVADYNGTFPKVCDVLGIPQYRDDERFCTITAIRENIDLFMPIIKAAFQNRDSAEVVEALTAANIVSGKLSHMYDVHHDPQAIENRYVVPVRYSSGRETWFPEPPVQFSEYQAKTGAPTAGVGADTEQVLKKLGYDEATICLLRENGTIK